MTGTPFSGLGSEMVKPVVDRDRRRAVSMTLLVIAPSSRRQDHHHLAAFEARFLLDLGELGRIVFDAIEELIASS